MNAMEKELVQRIEDRLTEAQALLSRLFKGITQKDVVGDLVSAGIYTRSEIIEKVWRMMPKASKGSIGVYITHGKNPKHNQFPKLIVENEDGILSFAD